MELAFDDFRGAMEYEAEEWAQSADDQLFTMRELASLYGSWFDSRWA